MKPNFVRRFRRRATATKTEGAFFKKESQESFFGGAEHESFFQPSATAANAHIHAPAVQRKCDECEKEDKEVQRQPDKKEEEKLMRAADPKEDEKVQREPEKKEEEKVQRAEDKKEEEKKIMKAPEKKEEEKLQRTEDKKEEEEKVQREPDKKEEEKEKQVQKKENGASASSGKNVSHYISSLDGKGETLSTAANQFYSSRMGYDFSNVKVHTDKEAAESASEINAKAYTTGNNIVFNEGQYDLNSEQGKKLMAHELTHVAQQNPSIQREPADAGVPMPAAPKRSALAQEMEEIWYNKGKTAFFDRLRILNPAEYNDTDTFFFILNNLTGDEKWLAGNLLAWGPEPQWNFTERVELEIRSLPQSRGFAGVSTLLKGADIASKRSVLKVLMPKLKGRLTKQEFAKLLADLNIAALVTSAGDNEKQWMLGDDELMKLLKQELTAPQFSIVVNALVDMKHLLPGVLRDTLIELLFSPEDIDRNTARAIINGRIVVYYIEDLKRPSNEKQILADNNLDPATHTAYIRPDNGQPGVIQKNYTGFNVRKTNMILGMKTRDVQKWKTLLVHETNHAMNPIDEQPLSAYQSEFRAYWVAEFRDEPNLDIRATKIKDHVLKSYISIKDAYNKGGAVKKAIDAYTRPDGNITNF